MSTDPAPRTELTLRPADPGASRLWSDAVVRLGEAMETVRSAGKSRVAPERLGLTRMVPAAPVLGALDRMGRPAEVRSVLKSYRRIQSWRGEVRIEGEGAAATGAAIWSLVDHARITEDLDYLDGVYGRVRRALRWLERTRTPDGTDPHAGLMPGSDPYQASFWAMAGAQEAARAGAVLHRRGLQHQGETLFHELQRAIRRSMERQGDEAGTSSFSGSQGDSRLSETLLSVMCGEIYPPDHEPVARALDRLLEAGEPSPGAAAVAGHQLLRRGDPRAWDLVDTLAARPTSESGDGGEQDLMEAALLFWLVRSLHLSDQRSILLLAPGHALRPLPDGGEVVVQDAPTIYGPVSYRLRREGEVLRMEWEGLQRHAPLNFIWPLPGRIYKVEPPSISLTDSRMAIRLAPEGGRLQVELVPDSFTTR